MAKEPATIIGEISSAAFAAAFPAMIQIRKRNGGKYPLYLSTSFGPMFLNTPKGQDLLLSSGVIFGANHTKPPEPEPEPEPEQEPTPTPKKGILSALLSESDFGGNL